MLCFLTPDVQKLALGCCYFETNPTSPAAGKPMHQSGVRCVSLRTQRSHNPPSEEMKHLLPRDGGRGSSYLFLLSASSWNGYNSDLWLSKTEDMDKRFLASSRGKARPAQGWRYPSATTESTARVPCLVLAWLPGLIHGPLLMAWHAGCKYKKMAAEIPLPPWRKSFSAGILHSAAARLSPAAKIPTVLLGRLVVCHGFVLQPVAAAEP